MFLGSRPPFAEPNDDDDGFSGSEYDCDGSSAPSQSRKRPAPTSSSGATVLQPAIFFPDIPCPIPNITCEPSDDHPFSFETSCSRIMPSTALSEFDPMSMLNVDMFAQSAFTPIDPNCFLQCESSANPSRLPPRSSMAASALRPDRSGTIKRELILEILGTGSFTEKEILKQIGDNRYSREIVRKLLQDGLIYRVGKGGAKDPFKYVAADLYHGPDKFPPLTPKCVDKRLAKAALKIHAYLCEAEKPLTEFEIRHFIGDNPGTGAALRLLVSMGFVQKNGLGSRKFTKEEVNGETLRILPGDPFRYHLNESGFSEYAKKELESLLKTQNACNLSLMFSCDDSEIESLGFEKPP